MIRYTTGDLLAADADALVNTVNCVGIMGRGVALQFKTAFPANFKAYEAACKRGEVQPGCMFVVRNDVLTGPKWIINFPTKRHWRGRSLMGDIEAGLVALRAEITERGIRTVALPPLGSGLGGLVWADVRTRIDAALRDLPGVEVTVFEPRDGDDRIEPKGEIPALTPSRAALIALMDRYIRGLMEPVVTLLEVQKLCYFLQLAGQPLRLRFDKGLYGPYAPDLRFVLRKLEGHYLAGYGDGGEKPTKPLMIVPGALEAAANVVASDGEVRGRFDRVTRLVEGFETPAGLELLATAHWVAVREDADTIDTAAPAFARWNDRKSSFTPRQIGIALERLRVEGWVGAAIA